MAPMIILCLAVSYSCFWLSSGSDRNAFSPQRFFLLFHFIHIFGCFILGAKFPLDTPGLIWLTSVPVFWLVGVELADRAKDLVTSHHAHKSLYIALSYSKRLIIACCAIGAITLVNDWARSGASINNIINLSLVRTADRYTGVAGQSSLTNITIIPAYLACMLAGLRFRTTSRIRSKWLLILPIVIVAGIGFANNTKGSIIYATILWSSGYITYSFLSDKPVLKIKTLLAVLVGMYVIIQLFALMQSIRYGGALSRSDMIAVLQIYGLAQISAFTLWFTDVALFQDTLQLGQRSFGSVARLIGMGATSEDLTIYLAAVDGNLTTTVTTAYAELIKDFGIYGALLAIVIGGAIATVVSRSAKRLKYAAVPLCCLIYSGILLSPITSILTYSTFLAAFILFIFLDIAKSVSLAHSVQAKNRSLT